MRYHYCCKKKDRCKISELPEELLREESEFELAIRSRSIIIQEDGYISPDSPIVWIVCHGIGEQPEVKCPSCDGESRKVIQKTESYLRGNCYLDIKGCKRDMNLYKLQHDDPYGYLRPPGDKDELIKKIQRFGKPKPKIYGPSSKLK